MSQQADERRRLIDETVAGIRRIEAERGVTRESVALIKDRLIRLAAREDLFTVEDYPPPPAGGERTSCLYRVSEDPDHRFALYVNCASGVVDTPAHNHTTWAAIAGVRGQERNRFYERAGEAGVRETGGAVVERGTAVAFLPADLHSIHMDGSGPVLNFHMYGLALEQLHRREFWSAKEQAWKIFPPHSDIREARGR
jgi:predicted metal-dependent enzyme (double-stranded beta helix superfamily)